MNTHETHPWVAEQTMRLRFGVTGNFADWDTNVSWAQCAEQLGFDSVWTADHPTAGANERESWVTQAVRAQSTERVRLGTWVNCVYYRHPVLLASQAADVDALSGGRVVLGLGNGDVPHEFEHFGLTFPPARERRTVLEETLRIVGPYLDGRPVTFEGTYYRTRNAQLPASTLPVQERIPILVGGGGEKYTLPLVARYADVSNFGAGTVLGGAWDVNDVRRKYDVLRRLCAELDRPFDSILRSYSFGVEFVAVGEPRLERRDVHGSFQLGTLVATPADVADHCRALVDAGVRYFILMGLRTSEDLRRFAEEVIPGIA